MTATVRTERLEGVPHKKIRRAKTRRGARDYAIIPGAQAVGFGFNITGTYDIESVTSRVFADTGLSPNPYQAPGGQLYSVPDNVAVIDDSETLASSYVTESQSDFQKKFAASVGAEVSAGVFSGEFNYAYSNSFESSASYYYCWLSAYWRSFSLRLEDQGSAQLNAGFASDLADLPAAFNDGSSRDYFDFIDKYGTHYVAGVTCGAAMRYYLAVEKTFSSDETTIHTDVELEYDAVFLDVKTKASADWETLTQNWASSRTVQIAAVGGDNSLVSLIDPGYDTSAHDAFQQWVDSMKRSPAITDFALRRLSLVCGDKAHAMNAAIDSYTNDALFVSADIEFPPTKSGVTTSFLIALNGNTIYPSPDVPMPPPQDSFPTSGFQIAVFHPHTFQTLLSRVYYFAAPIGHSDDVYASMSADVRNLPDIPYLVAVVGFGIDLVGNYPSSDVASWFINCGAALKDWQGEIASSSGFYFLNYLLVGHHGLQSGDATERFAIGNADSIVGALTTVSHLLHAQ
ncbi:MAG: hypothetical protein QOE68_3353 [Thermoanaerobaculia bacterium]|jgi:hypothetical protein|nr:hypothetical protein [Thermoanaerobaculia bacterium]